MNLVSLVVNYQNKQSAIQYIEENRSKFNKNELDKALKWANLMPSNYDNKDSKMNAIIKYLKNYYLE